MARLYDTARWRKGRIVYLRDNPWCTNCRAHGKSALATVVDHKIPHKDEAELFFDENNWQGLCAKCHNAKTAGRDGGFGNARKAAQEHIRIAGCDAKGIPLDRGHHWNKRT